MIWRVGRRILEAVGTLLVLSIVIFVVGALIPGDLALQMTGPDGATPERMEAFREQLGLDRPLLTRYIEWLAGVLRGDLGVSIATARPIGPDVVAQFAVSIELAGTSLFLAVILGIPLGVFAAVNAGSLLDRALRGMSLLFFSIPSFVSGVLLVLIGARYMRPLYTSVYVPPSVDLLANLRAMFLPTLAVGLPISAMVAQMTRATVLESLQEPFVDTARAKGVTERRIRYVHALKAALAPVVTLIGLVFGALAGGLIIVEQIFSLPGLGRGIMTAIGQRDFPVVVAGTLAIALVYVVVNLLVDLLYPVLDPRQRQ